MIMLIVVVVIVIVITVTVKFFLEFINNFLIVLIL